LTLGTIVFLIPQASLPPGVLPGRGF
jgi:hypothetical protein